MIPSLLLAPMRSLALGVAITDGHTRLAHLETDASLHAAFGAAGVNLVHPMRT
jgi:hypothetical protein